MFWMNPHRHRCCQHNSGQGWPYYAENLWYATRDNGLAAVFFLASEVTARAGKGVRMKISEKTHYPFEEKIEFIIHPDTAVLFPLYLRIPGWRREPELKINGEKTPLGTRPLSYIRIARIFNDNNKITLTLPMSLHVKKWEQNKNSISVNYGPLTFSLKIKENYVRKGGTDKWPAWEIYQASSWNYGLALDEEYPENSFRVIRKAWPESDTPFTLQNVPIELRAQARQIPSWTLDEKRLVDTIPPSPLRTAEPVETVTLIPMGAARIRISAFPVCKK